MSKVKITEQSPRRSCRPELLKQLHKIGFRNEGYDKELEKIIIGLGYDPPKQSIKNDELYYGYHIEQYQHYFLNYADACANEILFIHRKYFKNRKNGKKST